MKTFFSSMICLSILLTLNFYPRGLSSSIDERETARSRVMISDLESGSLIGRGDAPKKFLYGVGCGIGIVATIVGYAGGAFTGGLSTVLTGLTIVGATAAACAEAVS